MRRAFFGIVMPAILLLLGLQKPLAAAPPRLTALSNQTGKYQKIEFTIELPTTYANPYDPDEVDLALEIKTPSGKTVNLPAFYMQDYEYRNLAAGRRNADWYHPAGEPGWRARFAPMETGTHRACSVVKDKNGTAKSGEISFECTPSDSKGYIRVARANPRYFETSEGGPFFAVGQDLAFIGDGQTVSVAKCGEIFGKMAANGANYARIWTCCGDWAMAIEARKSAFGRSWEKKPTIAALPGGPERKAVMLDGEKATLNVAPSHTVGLKPSTRYRLRGAAVLGTGAGKLIVELGGRALGEPVALSAQPGPSAWEREFTTGAGEWRLAQLRLRWEGSNPVFLTEFSLKENGAGPELLWEADLNRPARGSYNPTDCFMLDQVVEAAEKNGIRLQLCIMTRDLYMKDLKDPKSAEYGQAIRNARKITRYAVARWGYSTAVASWEYWNEENPGLPTDRFYEELGKYLKEIDPFGHLRATSAWGPAPKDWRHPELDVADLHWYLRPAWGELARDEVAAVLDRAAFLRSHAGGRPALLSEFGLADDKWRVQREYMAKDRTLEHFHNSLWASALSGLSGTAMFWWWEQLDEQDAYRHYKGVAAFVADMPFSTAQFQPVAAKASDPRIRVVGLKSEGRADLWISNSEAAWHRRIIEGKEPGEIREATIELGDLPAGQYRVEWWDTMEGKAIKTETIQAGQGLRIVVPPFSSDIALKLLRKTYS